MKFKEIYEKHRKILEKEDPSIDDLKNIFMEIKSIDISTLSPEDKKYIDHLIQLAEQLKEKFLQKLKKNFQKKKALKEYFNGNIYSSSYRNKV